jgi:homoserine kinase
MHNQQIKIYIPATTANLGPGFDCLGMALDIWNEIDVSLSNELDISVIGEGAGSIKLDESNLVYTAAQTVFEEIGRSIPPLSIKCFNRIPLARGLGSSAAAIVGGLLAANSLSGDQLSEHQLLNIASHIEGHGDNVAPALLGGCRIVVQSEDKILTSSIHIPEELMAVVFIPNMQMPTKEARDILDKTIPIEDVIFNLSRVSLLINSLSTGQMDDLMVATEDRIHQPKRSKIFPAMKYVFRAAQNAGALGVFLSGGGSSIMALANSRFMTIGYEMLDAADKIGIPGEIKVINPTALGAQIKRIGP